MRFSLIFKFLFDKNVPLKEKWRIIIPLIYILSPVDLIPAPVFGFNIIDDGIMLVYLLTAVFDKTKKYYGNYDNKQKKQKWEKSNVVENVEYEMRNDEDEL